MNKIIKTKKNFSIVVDKKWKNRYLKRFDHPFSQADKVIFKNGKVLKIGKNIPTHKSDGRVLVYLNFQKLLPQFLLKIT